MEARQACPVLFEAVREIVERWPPAPKSFAGRSICDVFGDEAHPPKRVPSNRSVLRSLIRRIASAGPGARERQGVSDVQLYTPIPGSDRRSVVMRALGRPPLLYRQATTQRGRTGIDPVHIYVDVSGSIGEFKAALYGAVIDCHRLVCRPIHLFSTRVSDLSLEQLRRGMCRSTGGTDIGCVASHIAEHRVRRAVLLTDGLVGRAVGAQAEALSSVRIGVALTPGYSIRTDLEPFARHWAQLRAENQ
jgi:hypothetical protein